MEQHTSGNCTICTNYFSLLHWHHTIPQALGGVDSLQIPLCSDCHNVLHAHALAVVARTRSGRKIKKVYWPRPGDEERALPYLEILVNSILFPPIAPEDKEYNLQTKVNSDIHFGLGLLQQDLPGCKSMQQAVLYCIAYTLKSRGLYNDSNAEHREESSSQHQKPTAQLW